jgi:hypothetical protein
MIRGLSAYDILRSRGVAGLGTVDEKKTAQDNVNASLLLRRKIEPLYKKHLAALKKINPWWADNFNATAEELYKMRDNIDSKSESDWTGWADYVKGTAADRLAYEALLKQLEAIDAGAKPPPSQRPPTSGPATPEQKTETETPPADGKSNTMLYVGLGVAALLIFMAFSGEE